MISTTQTENEELSFADQSEDLKRENGQDTFDLVQMAMRAGLTEFTTPTPENGQGRVNWKVCRWFAKKDGKLTCFLVACKELNEHFEVIGPELDLSNGTPKIAVPPVKK